MLIVNTFWAKLIQVYGVFMMKGPNHKIYILLQELTKIIFFGFYRKKHLRDLYLSVARRKKFMDGSTRKLVELLMSRCDRHMRTDTEK